MVSFEPVTVGANVSLQMTARPQNAAFIPRRLLIARHSEDFIIEDVTIGNRSQFSQAGSNPGDMFAVSAIDGFVSFEPVLPTMDIRITVRNVGVTARTFACTVIGDEHRTALVTELTCQTLADAFTTVADATVRPRVSEDMIADLRSQARA